MDNVWYDFQQGTMFIRAEPALAREAPQKTRPDLVLCNIQLDHLKKDGSPDRIGMAAITDFETEATKAAKSDSAVYAGRVSREKTATFGFYSADGEKLIRRFQTSSRLHHATFFRCYTKKDAGWSFYLDILYPSPLERSRMDTNIKMTALRRQGDDGFEERDVDHFARFPTQSSREEFINYAIEKEYGIKHTPTAVDDDGSWHLIVSKRQRPMLLHLFSHSLMKKAGELAGRYVEWQCDPVTSATKLR